MNITRTWPLWLLLWGGCPPGEPVLEVTLDIDDAYDECNICVGVSAVNGAVPAAGGGLRRSVDGSALEAAGELDHNGEAEVCFFPMKPGEHEITVAVTAAEQSRIATATIQICAFGYDWGIVKNSASREGPASPVVVPFEGNPVLDVGAEGDWDADTIMMPTVAPFQDGYLMLYGGRGDDYRIGAATSDDGVDWTRLDDDPVMDAGFAGDWTNEAVNSPSVLAGASGLQSWYQGSDGHGIAIGMATSDDGEVWAPMGEAAVFEPGSPDDWDHSSVGHPAVLQRDGVYEMWYASGSLQIGHAISADGQTWTRYCQNPVFLPLGFETWEGGATKSPEVLFLDGTYHLFFSAGGPESWQVGHAASVDGLRWARTSDSPVLPRGDEGDWNEAGTINAFAVVEEGEVTIWYTGVSGGPSSIGMATVEGWE